MSCVMDHDNMLFGSGVSGAAIGVDGGEVYGSEIGVRV